MHPYLLRFGHLYLPTFGVLAAAGLILALFLSQRTARLVGLNPDKLWDAGLFAIVAAFVSSRVLLVLTNLHAFLTFPILLLAVPSLTATGLLFTAIALLLWLRFKRMPMLRVLDAWAPCATLLWAFLALGHFAEGSDPGTPTHLPWGTHLSGNSTLSHPVALYASVLATVLTAAAFTRLRTRTPAGQLAGATLLLAGIAQFFLSFVRQPGAQTIVGLDMLQAVALGLIISGIALLWAR